MLQATNRQKDPQDSVNHAADKERLESYSNLLFDMVTRLGFVLPDLKYEDDPLRKKYQPAKDYESTTMFLLTSNIFNYPFCFRMSAGYPQIASYRL